MLLDVSAPGWTAFTVIRKMREVQIRTQAIIVSARDSMSDVVFGLDAGADDYLTKPFALDVLLAKVRAAARRVASGCKGDAVRGPDPRPHLYELQRGDRIASLTRTECALLSVLMRRARSVVPHAVLIDQGWSADADVSFDSLYVFIRALRAKITQPGEKRNYFIPSAESDIYCGAMHAGESRLDFSAAYALVCCHLSSWVDVVWRGHVVQPQEESCR